MKRSLLAIAIILGCAGTAFAQGSRYDSVVQGIRGPIGGATVAICTAAASTTAAPCNPLATIYTDATETVPATNPFTSDGLGNYGFWAAPGKYQVQIYGAGLTPKVQTVVLACDVANCQVGSITSNGAITGLSLNVSGNVTATGSVSGSNIPPVPLAGRPAPSDAHVYVSINGNDSNDCLSWGTACLTIYAAIQKLPQFSSGGVPFQQGWVYVTDGVNIGGPISGQGLWLLGFSDSHVGNIISTASCTAGVVTLTFTANHGYTAGQQISVFRVGGGSGFNITAAIASVPSSTTLTYPSAACSGSGAGGDALLGGFLRVRSLRLQCFGGTSVPSFQMDQPVCTIGGNSSTDPTKPALWVSSTIGMTFDGISISGCIGAQFGFDSSGTGSNNVSNLVVHRSALGATGNNAACGPAVKFGGGGNSEFFDHVTFNAINSVATTLTSISRAGNTVTAIVNANNNFTAGQQVGVLNVSGGAVSFNGTFTLIAPTSGTTLTWNQNGDNATGTITSTGGCASNSTQSCVFLAANNDNRAAFLTPGPSTSGPIRIEDSQFNGGGGIRWYNTVGGSSLYVKNVLYEGVTTQCQPIFDLKNGPTTLSAVRIVLESVSISDCVGTDRIPIVRTSDSPVISPEEVIVRDSCFVGGLCVDGPATIENNYFAVTGANPSSTTYNGSPVQLRSPQAIGQTGYFLRRSLYQSDEGRRFPGVARVANLGAQLPASWSTGAGSTGTGIVVRSCAAPDGTNNAGCLTSTGDTGGTSSVVTFRDSAANRVVNVGDYFVQGTWAQAGSGAGPGVSTTGAVMSQLGTCTGFSWIVLNTSNEAVQLSGSTTLNSAPYGQTDGGWQWVWGVARTTGSATNCILTQGLFFNSTLPQNFYAPYLAQIPAATFSNIGSCTISSITEDTSGGANGSKATIVTSAACPVAVAQLINVNGTTNFNGVYFVSSVTNSTTFTVLNTTVPNATVNNAGNVTAVGDSEAVDFAMNLVSYPDNCPTGHSCGLRGVAADQMRFGNHIATAQVAGNIALSAGWGATAAVSAVSGSDQSTTFTVTSNGTGIAANPTITITFADGTWSGAPGCFSKMTGGTGAITQTTDAPTAANYVITFSGTPAAGSTYVFTTFCIGR